MLVAISGSQGSGKSTIVNLLADRGFETIERKTSRSILNEWGVTLQDVNDNGELTTRFQAEISHRKFSDEKAAIESSDLWFTERTHADLFTYALVSLGKDNNYSEWLNQYYVQCMEYSQYYSAVYYLRAGHFNIESDGVRGAGVHYSRMVDLVMLDTTKQMVQSGKLTVIDTPDLSQRVGIIAMQSSARANIL
jgi:predicted ATPase